MWLKYLIHSSKYCQIWCEITHLRKLKSYAFDYIQHDDYRPIEILNCAINVTVIKLFLCILIFRSLHRRRVFRNCLLNSLVYIRSPHYVRKRNLFQLRASKTFASESFKDGPDEPWTMGHDESIELTSFAINRTRKSSNDSSFHTIPLRVLMLFEIKKNTGKSWPGERLYWLRFS
jgi:hypothetical protein